MQKIGGNYNILEALKFLHLLIRYKIKLYLIINNMGYAY